MQWPGVGALDVAADDVQEDDGVVVGEEGDEAEDDDDDDSSDMPTAARGSMTGGCRPCCTGTGSAGPDGPFFW